MNANRAGLNTSHRRRAGALAILAAIAFVVATACNPGTGPAPTKATPPATGVLGVVLAGPTCPVERPGQSQCVRPVAGAVILALDSAGNEVDRAVSDAAGVYFLPLVPGSYRIVPQAVDGLMGTPGETAVTVSNGAPLQLDLQYDTGIR
jgi:hypothetical protein